MNPSIRQAISFIQCNYIADDDSLCLFHVHRHVQYAKQFIPERHRSPLRLPEAILCEYNYMEDLWVNREQKIKTNAVESARVWNDS